ncbi:MAG TPA: amino acid adenylation domain-containing protein [Longimicrobium sp.]|nr:amino acid adenylation domain-containing protein [Longimicrobium sp.]
MSDLPDRVAALSRAKRALLDKVLMRGPAAAPGIPRAAAGPVPLTFEQRRLWFLHRVSPDASVYSIPLGFRIRGELDAGALRTALAGLVARHDALRTTFAEAGDEPVQTVGAEPRFGWETADAAGLTDAERDADARRIIRGVMARPFELARGPLLRAVLVRVGEGEHVLALALAHIVGDGWTTGIVRRELGELYTAAVERRAAVLPALAAGFRDFAAWQRKALHDRALEPAVEHWKRELAGAPHVFEIVGDRPRPAAQAFAGAKAVRVLDPALTAEIAALARREGTTPFAVLTAAWAAVLHRHARQDDFLLGTLVANRWAPEMEGMVGFFANTVPLRFRYTGRETVRDAIRAAHATVLAAREHARLPFDRIVEIAGLRRDPSRPTLVQSMVVMSDGASVPPAFPGADVSFKVVDGGASAFDMTLVIEDLGDRLHAELQFATTLYDPPTAYRLLTRLESTLRAFTAGADRPLAQVPMADADELRRLTGEWSGGDRPFPDACIHHLFERSARERPDAVAIAFGETEEVTYAALNARANRIARRLRRLGAGPETRVGICMARTPELVAAMLGVLKAGAAYVPVDPAHPPARAAAVLHGARATAVLTDAASRAALTEAPALLSIDLDRVDLAGESDADVDGGAVAGSLAYVMTTSGSTGGPKGVEIEHRGAVALIDWVRHAVGEADRATVLAATSIGFDSTLMEIFGTLSWGGCVVLTDGVMEPVPAGRAPRLGFVVPSVAAELLREGHLPPTVRVWMIGGETVPPALAREIHASGGVQRVIAVYGPTEDTTYSTAWEIPRDVRRMSVGAPIANGRAYVLDAGLRPVPVGAPGEVWLAGAGLARGYAGRPGLTAERFVPSPFGPPGTRMYRTLDVGRWLDDGTLEHLGRADAQVKVRGVRIESGEVETALATHPAIAAAAVDARGDGASGRRLIAWLVLRDGARPAAPELREHLRARLPEAMVPSAFAWVDALPRTAGGKIDRRALADPPPESAVPGRATQPRSPAETRLAAIWADALSLPRVGIHDDFFDLGGNSITASRLAARVRAETGRDLPLAALLAAPTVAGLARVLEGEHAAVQPPLIPLQPHGTRPPLFLAPPGGGHVVCYHALAGLMGRDQPVFGLQARGIDDGHAPLETAEEIAEFFAAAVREHHPDGPYLLSGWSFGGVVAWEMARRLRAAGAEVAMVALLDTGVPRPKQDPAELLDHARVLQRIVADLVGWGMAGMVRVDRIGRLPHRQQAIEAVRQVSSPRLLPMSRVDEILTLTRVRRANLGALVAYEPPSYDGHLTYVRTAASDRAVPHDGAVEYWTSRALGGATVHRVGGTHGTLLHPPFVADLAEKLGATIRTALDRVAVS